MVNWLSSMCRVIFVFCVFVRVVLDVSCGKEMSDWFIFIKEVVMVGEYVCFLSIWRMYGVLFLVDRFCRVLVSR